MVDRYYKDTMDNMNKALMTLSPTPARAAPPAPQGGRRRGLDPRLSATSSAARSASAETVTYVSNIFTHHLQLLTEQAQRREAASGMGKPDEPGHSQV